MEKPNISNPGAAPRALRINELEAFAKARALETPDDARIHDQLSDTARQAIENVCLSRGVPEEFALAPALAALSIACGSKVRVITRTLSTPVNLWLTVVAPSGSNKSTPARDLLNPIIAINRILNEEYQINLEDALKNAKKCDIQLARAAVKRKQLIIDDATPEARNQALRDNYHGLLLYADELAATLSILDRYGAGDTGQMMSIHDGADIQINRKGEPTDLIQSPFLSLFGTIQPDVYYSKLLCEKNLQSGFAQRFLPFSPRKIEMISYCFRSKPDEEVLKRWENLLMVIYTTESNIDLTLSPLADTFYSEFFDQMEERKHSKELSAAECSFLGKLQVAVLKLAGLAAISHFDEPGAPYQVQVGDMRWAIRIAERVFENFSTALNLSRSENVSLCLQDIFVSLKKRYPGIITPKLLIDTFGIGRSTAYRWLAAPDSESPDILDLA